MVRSPLMVNAGGEVAVDGERQWNRTLTFNEEEERSRVNGMLRGGARDKTGNWRPVILNNGSLA